MMLSVVIPVFNEEKTIAETIEMVCAEKTPKEIIIVDDGSVDKTREILKEISVRNPKIKIIFHESNYGKGAAVRTGIKAAVGDVLVIQDADLEYDPKYYKYLLNEILKKKARVVFGSRLKNLKLKLVGNDKTPLPLHYLMNFFLAMFTNLLYGSKLTDMETGCKMMVKEVYQNINLTSDGFDIEPEITAKILRSGLSIVEIPIETRPRGYKEGKKIRARDAYWAVLALIKFKFASL